MHWQQNHEEGLQRTDWGLNAELIHTLTNVIPLLHFACMHPCTLWYLFCMKTLQSLSDVAPEEAWMQFFQGMLPFHYACHAGAPQSVLKWCKNQYPDAAHVDHGYIRYSLALLSFIMVIQPKQLDRHNHQHGKINKAHDLSKANIIGSAVLDQEAP